MDVDLTLELCKNTEEYVRAEHYGAAIPDSLYFDCETTTDCGGLAHRPCYWKVDKANAKVQRDSKCSKHKAWDSYLAHRSADDAVVSRKVPLEDYPYR